MSHKTNLFRRGLPRRLYAMMLAVCMVFTMSPPMTAAEASNRGSGKPIMISGFAELAPNIREQNVTPGTSLDKLNLPDTLEATVCAKSEDTVLPTDSLESLEPEESHVQPSEPADIGTTDNDVDAPPVENGTMDEEISCDTAPQLKAVPGGKESGKSAEEESEAVQEIPASAAEVAAFSSRVKAEQYLATPVKNKQKIVTLSKIKTPLEASPSDVAQKETITVHGVTWDCDPIYSEDIAGTYIFTAILPDGYAAEEGVAMPTITVTIEEDAPLSQPDILVRPYDEDTSSDVMLYLADDYDTYQWESGFGGWWQPLEEQTGTELQLCKEDFLSSGYRCLLTKDGTEVYSQPFYAMPNFENARISTFAAAAPWEISSDYLRAYGPSDLGFDLHGKDGLREYKTTFYNRGYGVMSKVNGYTIRLNPESNHVAMGSGLFCDMSWKLVSGGRYLQVTYTVTNEGAGTQSFQIGSYSDVMIDTNDRAPIQGAGAGRLTMTDGKKYQFNLIAQGVTTLWYGFYGGAYKQENIFGRADMKNGSSYSGDSGLAYSWDGTVSPGGMWKKTALIGIGAIAPPPEFTVAPSVDKTTVSPNGTLNVSGTVNCSAACTIYAALDDGTEFTLYTGPTGTFSKAITVPGTTPPGATNLQVWAISTEGGTSDFYNFPLTVTPDPFIELTDTVISVPENTAIDDLNAYFKQFIKSSSGTVSIATGGFSTAAPGSYTITYTAAMPGFSNDTVTLTALVTPVPLKLVQNDPARVGTTNSFTLSAVLQDNGGLTITETGFVWGIMQSPTTAVNNGKTATASAVTAKGGTVRVTAADIADGVNYYARPYAIAGGKTYYGNQKSFDIGGKQYGTFAVSNDGNNTFTITRTGGSENEQTVYYRTVNGSAVGGTHFTHAANTVVFAAGETSKKVTVIEWNVNASYDRRPATAYTNADRTYQLEIYKVEGGGKITGGVNRAQRAMPKTTAYAVDRSHYQYRVGVTANSIGDGRTGTQEREVREDHYGIPKANGDFTYAYKGTRSIPNLTLTPLNVGLYPNNEMNYIRNTASAMRVQLQDLNCTDDTTYMVYKWVLFNTTSDNPQLKGDKKEKLQDLPATTKYALIYGNEPTGGNTDDITIVTLPKPLGTQLYPSTRTPGRWHIVRDAKWAVDQPSNEYVRYGFDETCYISLGSYGGSIGNQYMSFNSGKLATAPEDTTEPQLVGVAPMAGGTYKPGDSFTISLIFDEIVDSTNSSLSSVSLNTNYGTMNYAGGGDTNVLYFTGFVPEGASNAITVNSINNAANIKDMCDQAGTASGGSGSGSITVDNTRPTITIADDGIINGTAKGTIIATDHTSIKYTWTQTNTMPVSGWLNCTSGYIAQTRRTSGIWYLHAIAERNSNGTANYTSAAFNFDNASSVLPTLTVSADNTNWAKNRTITVTSSPVAATVSYTGPQSGTAGGTVTVTKNGLYTFTLTSGGETITEMVSVSKVDTASPTVTVTGPAVGSYGEPVAVNIAASDTGGSGIASVTGTWNKQGGGSQSATGLTVSGGKVAAPDSSGTWTLSVTATDGAGNTKTASSAAYTIVKEQPTVTVTRTATYPKKGDTYSYTVTVPTGVTLDTITLPDGRSTAATSGSFTLTEVGTWYVTVSDTFGHVVRSSAMTIAAGIDGAPPEVRLSQSTDDWVKNLTITASVFDNVAPTSASWNLGNGTAASLTLAVDTDAAVGNQAKKGSFIVTQNGTYTVTASDANGNIGTATIEITNIDDTVPAVTVGTPAANWTSVAQNIPVTYTDSKSGINTAQYAITTTNSGTKPATLTNLPASGGTVSVTTNGTNYIYYKVIDNAGNVTDGYSEVIKVDTTLPTLTVSGNPTAWQNIDATLLITVSQAGPTGQTVTLQKDSDPAQPFTGTTYTATRNGTFTITVTTGVGKTVTKTVVVDKIDKMPPKVTRDTIATEWKNTDRTINYTWVDLGDDGQTIANNWKTAKYAITASSAGPEPTALTDIPSGGKITIPVAGKEGFYYIYHRVEDNAGNVSSGYSAAIKMDSVAPTISVTGAPESGWVNTTPNLSVAFSDSGSGMGKLFVSIDGGGYSEIKGVGASPYSYRVTDGSHTYKFKVEDTAGNIAESGTVTVNIDTTKPANAVVTLTPADPNGKNGWHKSLSVGVAQPAADSGSSITTYYKLWPEGQTKPANGTALASGAASIPTPADGAWSLKVYTQDAAGNSSAESDHSFKLDTAAPVIGTLTYSEEPANLWQWIIGKTSLIITVPVTESGSGVDKISYIMTPHGGGSAESKTAAISGGNAEIAFDKEFKGAIAISCTDKAGNQSATVNVGRNGVIVENHAPSITIVERKNQIPNSNGWYNTYINLDATVKDDGVSGGLAWVDWKFDESGTPIRFIKGSSGEGKYVDFSEKLTTDFVLGINVGYLTDGEHTVYVQAADNAGNVSAWQTFAYKKDTQKPTINTPSLSESGYTAEDITVSVDITDNWKGSGIKSVTVIGAAGGTMTLTKQDNTYQFTTTQNDTFTITATDYAGNVETSEYKVFNIDKTSPKAPTIAITGGAEGNNGWYIESVTFAVTKGDNSDVPSGTTSFAYSIDSGATWSSWQPFSGGSTFAVETDGDYTGKIVAKTRSNAGAVSPASAPTGVKIDRQTPMLTIVGGEIGSAQFDFAIASDFGPSGGVITVSKDGEAAQTVTDGKYTVTKTGKYIINATSGSGLEDETNRWVFAVGFDSKGGSDVAAQLVAENGQAAEPTKPKKAGYAFKEWRKAGESVPYSFDSDVTDNVSLQAVWELGAPSVRLAVDNTSPTYNGDTAATLTASPTHASAGATYAYEWYKGSTKIDGQTGSTLELQTVADSGNYTVRVTASGDGITSPQAESNAVTVTIAKAPVSFGVSDNTHDYDGNPKTANVAQTAGETPDVTGKFTVSYEKDGSPVTNPTSMGIYTVLVELTDANFKHKSKTDSDVKTQVGTLTINGIEYPDADTMTWPTAADISYGKKLSDSVLTGGDQAAKGTYTWTTSDIVPTVQNDGYWVMFTPADGNYAPVEKITNIKVDKATPTLKLPTAAGITYGETLEDSSLTGGSASTTYNGTANTNVPGKYKWITPAAKPAVSDSGSTEYGMTFTPDDTDNYNMVTTGKLKLTVAQREVTLRWSGHTGLTYTGRPVAVSAAVTNLVEADSCAVTVAEGTKTNAGNYTAMATALDNENYKLPADVKQAYTIAKKPVKVLWSDLFPTYDGTAKSPTIALDGVLNSEDCTVVSTGSAAEGNAGRYKVSAALQGTSSGNYTMQNPGEILVIQPAPVSISLSDYSYKYDGAAKYATVTATPDVPITVTYKLAGNEVAAPIEEGVYDILVGINGKNYRFEEGTDGKSRRMGALTIYKEKPPELYTITFAPGALDAAGTAPMLPAAVKDTVHILPSNSFLRAGHAFVGWKNGNTLYQPGERFVQPANNGTVFTAQWESATYDIGGVVDQDGKPIANVRVVLMRGAEQVAETVTNQIGEYHFDNVLPGLYNLVSSKPSPDGVGDIIMTIMVEVKAADVEQANITLPNGKTNSIVEVAPGTPKIIVGNLDQTFKNTEGNVFTPEDKAVVNKGGTVEIKFIAEEKQKSNIIGDAGEISKEAGHTKIGLYLALDVEKTVTQPADPSTPDVEPPSDTTPIPETSVLLESVIPLPSDLQGKQSYTVYRVHEGSVDSLTTGADSGERIEISADKTTLILHAQKFSTYAIAYTEKSSDAGSSSGGNTGGTKTDSIQPGITVPVAPVTPVPTPDVPDNVANPTRPGTTTPDASDTDDADEEVYGEDTEYNPDRSNMDAQKDRILAALEDAIKNLPDTLTDEQRQAVIKELNRITDNAIAALNSTNDPKEAKRIAVQACGDMEKLVAEALALVGGSEEKPFVILSALLAMVSVLLSIFALLKRQNRRRKLFSSIFAVLAVTAFLLTNGWSGFTLANWWTLAVSVFSIGAAMGVFARHSKQEEQP